MLLSTAEDLARFLDELGRETDRGLALVATALIDDRLTETLRCLFIKGPSTARLLDEGNSPLGTLSSRVDACSALGLIDDFEAAEITLIRKVRNEFAHAKHGISFQASKIHGLCASLKSPLPEGEGYPLGNPRFRFTNAAVCIVLRLYHRPEWVARERREPKEWVPMSQSEWRSFEKDPPSPREPIVGIGWRQPSSTRG